MADLCLWDHSHLGIFFMRYRPSVMGEHPEGAGRLHGRVVLSIKSQGTGTMHRSFFTRTHSKNSLACGTRNACLGDCTKFVIAVTCLMAALFAFQADLARAQSETYSIGVDLPLEFIFTGDLSGAVSTSGFKLTLDTPFNVGVGYESYSVEANDEINNIFTILDYTFMDVFVDAYFPVMHLALGYGIGTVTSEPFTLSGVEFNIEETESSQWYLSFGWPLNPAWEFHLGYHRITAEATLLINGVDNGAKIDLGGIMHSLGFKYIF